MKSILPRLALILIMAMVLQGCADNSDSPATKTEAKTNTMPMSAEAYAAFVAPEDSLPYLRFFDGDQVSLNDRCPVRKVRLNPKMAPAYVNGQPVGFC